MPETTSPPRPNSNQIKRPWYLTMALLLCLAVGVSSWLSNWSHMEFLRGPQPAAVQPSDIELTSEENRFRVAEAKQRYIEALFHEKKKGSFFVVALFVMGMAITFLSSRAFGGREASSKMLAQVMIVRYGLLFAMYLFLPEQRLANWNLQLTHFEAVFDEQRQTVSRPTWDGFTPWMKQHPLVGQRAYLVIEATFTLGVLLALYRKRSRRYFELAQAEINNHLGEED